MKVFRLWFVTFLLLSLSACQTAGDGTTIETATSSTPLPRMEVRPVDVAQYPIAQSLNPEAIAQVPEMVRAYLEEGQQEARSLLPQEPPGAFMGPVLIPENPLHFQKDWVNWIGMASEQRLIGYLGMAANAPDEQSLIEALVSLLVDYQQVKFYLGGNLAEAHLVQLPQDQYTVFEFALAEPLAPGVHDLVFVVNLDPYNKYMTRAVIEKHRRGGRITFSAAGGYFLDKPVALRRTVIVSDTPASSPIPLQDIVPFEPGQTDILNQPLLLALTGDMANPLIRKEPALVANEDNKLYAFVYYDSVPPEALLPEAKAALFAFLDGKQVPIDGEPAILWEVQAGKRYRIPLRLTLPAEAADGAVHSLNMGVVVGALEDWRVHEPQERWMGMYSFVFRPSPVPVVSDRTLIDYIWSEQQ